MSDLYNKGAEVFNQVYCGDIPHPEEKGSDKFFDYMLENLFAQCWGDNTVSIKERRLVLIGAIIAQGEEMTFAIQARSAMKNGELTFEQLEEIMLLMTQYVGYPKASRLRMTLLGLKKEFANK